MGWTIGADLTLSRYNLGGAGTTEAALAIGGSTDGFNGLGITDEYNGTSWSAGGNLAQDIFNPGGCGTQTAALAVAGFDQYQRKCTQIYNGTAWSLGNDLLGDKDGPAAGGTTSSALRVGGQGGDGTPSSVEEYNGSTWSITTTTNNPSEGAGGNGAVATFLAVIGTITEQFDGTIWTTTGDVNHERGRANVGGNKVNGLCFGDTTDTGDGGVYVNPATELYRSSVWTEGSDMNVVIRTAGGDGSSIAAFSAGGATSVSTHTAATEFYGPPTFGRHKGISGLDSGALFNGKTLVGDKSNGKIYYLDMDTYTEDGSTVKRIRRTQIINKENVNVMHNRLEIEFEPGVGLDVAEDADGEDPKASLKWSDDEGNTWSDAREVSIGEYQEWGTRAVWRSLGKSRNRIYELTIESPVKCVIVGAYSDLKACRF